MNTANQPFVFNSLEICFLQRPVIPANRKSHPEVIFTLEKRNYNVFATIGLTVPSKILFVVLRDNEASSSFIRVSEIPKLMKHKILKLYNAQNICNASCKAVPIIAIIDIILQIRASMKLTTLLVTD